MDSVPCVLYLVERCAGQLVQDGHCALCTLPGVEVCGHLVQDGHCALCTLPGGEGAGQLVQNGHCALCTRPGGEVCWSASPRWTLCLVHSTWGRDVLVSWSKMDTVPCVLYLVEGCAGQLVPGGHCAV